MKQNINIEAEGNELVLKNKAGDYVIIPKKYRLEVQDMIKDGCHKCIDSLVETLPVMEDYAQDGSLLPDWDKIKAILNPKNWGVPDYTYKGSRAAAFAAARKAGEKEFMWNNGRYNTRKDTDKLNITTPTSNNPNNYTGEIYSDYIQTNYPEFFKLINRGEGLNNIKFEGLNGTNRAYYSKKENTIYVGENTDMTNDNFIGNIIAEMAHQKDNSKNNIVWGSWDKNYFYERPKYGEDRYNVPGTLEYNTHRLYEPGLAMIAYGDLSPNDIKRIQKHLGVKEDGYFGEITYKALQEKYKDSPYIQSVLKDHQFFTQDKDKNPIAMGKYSKLAKAYLHQINQDVPLRDSKRFFDPLQYSDYTDNALLNIKAGSGDYDVRELQRALAIRGYKLPKSTKKDGTFDGVWGDETKNALIDWQNKKKSKPIVNKATELDKYSKFEYKPNIAVQDNTDVAPEVIIPFVQKKKQ